MVMVALPPDDLHKTVLQLIFLSLICLFDVKLNKFKG